MAQSGPDPESDHDGEGAADTSHDADSAAVDATADDASTDESEWQFGLDEVGPDGVVEADPEPLEPGRPRAENVFFVLLGVAGTLLLLSTVL